MVVEDKIYEPVFWPYHLLGNLFLMAFVWLMVLGVITIRLNLFGQQVNSLLSELYGQTAEIGWGLDDVTLEGHQKTSGADVLKVIDLRRGDNILQVDLLDIQEKVKMLPWVKHVSVTRRYFPNVIHINIKEKQVRAIWQYQKEFYPLDEDGNIIETDYIPQQNVIQIVGEGAPEHIKELLEVIENDKELFERLKAANFISKRRWDLIFDDVEEGIVVKMPEKNLEEAWHKLVKLDKTKGILKRKLTFIDLRLKNKVIVKIKDD